MSDLDLGFAITWLGHSTLLLETSSGKRLMVDPWLEGNPMAPVGAPQLAQLDAILVTHAHSDHVGAVIPLAKRFHCPVIAGFEACAYLERKGVTTTAPMGKGGTQRVAGVAVTMVHAVHSSSFDDGASRVYAGEPAGFVVTLESDRRVYFAGDTGPMLDMQLIGDLYAPDLAVLPIGDLFTMGPREAAYAARLLRARWILPIHWGTFPALTGTPEALRFHLTEMGVAAQVLTAKIGEPIR